MNSHTSWGAPARFLHWAMAGVILFLLGLGVWMTYGVTDLLEQFRLVQIHKSWGFVAFALALVRVAWRLVDRITPKPPVDTTPAKEMAAKVTHGLLYALILILPLSGWLMASASGLQDTFGVKNEVFGWFEMYDPFVPGDKSIELFFGRVHFYASIALTALLITHAGAAFWHHFGLRNDVLKRMTLGG